MVWACSPAVALKRTKCVDQHSWEAPTWRLNCQRSASPRPPTPTGMQAMSTLCSLSKLHTSFLLISIHSLSYGWTFLPFIFSFWNSACPGAISNATLPWRSHSLNWMCPHPLKQAVSALYCSYLCVWLIALQVPSKLSIFSLHPLQEGVLGFCFLLFFLCVCVFFETACFNPWMGNFLKMKKK